ncbi:MAG: ribosome biogenesis GTPase YqeH [Anaerorhabdus sp.]
MKCKGCGAKLQYNNENKIGYTPKVDGDYCKRCFRLTHYDELDFSMKTGIDPDDIFRQVNQKDALILWVVDLFDFEASMVKGLHRHLPNKDILMVATKRDLLPETLGNDKLARFIFGRLKQFDIHLSGLVVTGKDIENGKMEVMRAVEQLAKGRDIIVLGKANAGKSTLLNALIGENQLTSSRYPGTTLDFNMLSIQGHTFIDTPGLEGNKTVIMDIDEKDLKAILPFETIKPRGFQCKGNQSFAIAGLARLDFYDCSAASIVFYVSNRCDIHRGKIEGAEKLWKEHYGKLLQPTTSHHQFSKQKIPMAKEKMDIVIDGLGWISVSGKIKEIEVTYPQGVNVSFRKAMI